VSVPPLRLPFVSEDIVRQISKDAGEPDWLLAERMDALGRVVDLPAESNQLFTPYLDLRAVKFAELVPYPMTGQSATSGDVALPEGAAAIVEVDGDSIKGVVL
jgi:hypothetical protein